MEHEQVKTEKQPASAKKEEVVIAIKGLKKSFGNKHVLKGINLELKRGENIVILGRSGGSGLRWGVGGGLFSEEG